MGTPVNRREARRTRSVLGLVPLLDLARQEEVDVGRLLARARIAQTRLTDPRARVTVAEEHALVRGLLAATREPSLGLDAGRFYHLAAFGLLGTAVGAAPTVRDVVRLFLEHIDLTYTPFAVARDLAPPASPDSLRLLFTDDEDLGALRRFYLDRDVSFVLEVARTLWPSEHAAVVRRVALDYPEPAEAARYRARASCHVEFGATVAAVEIDLGAAPPRSDASALGLRLLEAQLGSVLADGVGGEDAVRSVRRTIAGTLASRAYRPSAAEIARALHVPERTLRRRLSEAGSSFRALEDEVLSRLAERLLAHPSLSLDGVAERLGYSEAASFVRAYRRWTGETPRGRARARARGYKRNVKT